MRQEKIKIDNYSDKTFKILSRNVDNKLLKLSYKINVEIMRPLI